MRARRDRQEVAYDERAHVEPDLTVTRQLVERERQERAARRPALVAEHVGEAQDRQARAQQLAQLLLDCQLVAPVKILRPGRIALGERPRARRVNFA
jgi:hypothetical protein